MATCPNKNLDEWKSLVAAKGEDIAYYLWDKYEGDVPLSEYGDTMFQLEEAPSTAASPEIIARVKELLKKMGVNIETLTDYAKKSSIKISGVNAVADLVRGVVAVAEGKEDVALTEEMVHIATAILEQKNPTLVTEMISKIDRFKIYKDTLELYKNNKFYQLPNGKPDIRKIKKEAVDKLITELIVNGNTGDANFPELAQEENVSLITRWWNAITDFFRKMYKSSNIDIFQQAAQQIMEGGVEGQVSDIVNKTIYAQGRTPYIKPGVQEIFNQNPELANAVYETLEFKTNNINLDFEINIGNTIIINAFFEGKLVGNITIQKSENNYFVRNVYSNFENKGIGTELYKKAIEYVTKQGGVLKPDVLSAPQSYSIYKKLEKEGLFKIENVSEQLEDGRYEVIGKSTGILPTSQPTPQQKQQAQQLYSQYLDAAGEGLFFQLAEPTQQQKDVQRRIQETRENLRKGETDSTIDLLTLGDSDAVNFYEYKQPDGTWKKVTKRVTDRVKRYYRDKFGDKTFTKEEKEFNEFKRNLGVQYHGYFEEIHDRYFNKDGTRKTKPEPRRDIRNRVDLEVYNKLENYYVNLIESRSKDGKNPLVFSEVKVYDPREKEAGTIDLLIVDEDGTGHIIDWKFMSVAQGQRDIPWYKPDAYGIQLRRYRDILLFNYGVKKISMNRAIPILFEIAPAKKNVEDSKPALTGINIGSVNTAEIEDLRLIPISEKTETTGFESLDTLIKELNAVLDNIASKKATSEEDREFKKERLRIVREAIRVAQGTMNIKPVVDVVMIMQQEGQNLLEDYKTIYQNADPRSNEFTNKQLSDFASDLRDYNAIAKVFGTISDRIGDLIYNKNMESMGMSEEEIAERKELLQNLEQQSKDIRMSREEVFKVSKDFADKFMGVRNLVTGLLNAEAVVKGLSAWFRSVSDIPLRSVQIMMKLVDNAKIRASNDAKSEVEELITIRKKLADRGGDLRSLVQKIYQKDDDNKLINKLIYKYKKQFRDEAANNALEGNKKIQWIKDNVDTESYMVEVDTLLKKKIERIKKDYANNEEMRDRLILQENQKYDIRRPDFNGWTNEVLLRHPQDKWLSEEYLELQKDPELLSLYEFIGKVNKKGKEIGYLTNQGMSTFLPWVRKSMAESLAWDFSLSTIANFGNKLSLQPDDVGRGVINPLTKEIEEGIPKYYTQDFTRLPEGGVDTSEVSEDLFANMILYINHLNKYKYLSEVEGQLQLIKDIEKFKEHHLKTSTNGNIIIENGIPQKDPGNEKNAEMYDQFLRAVLYDQKYPLDESDVTMSLGVMDYFKNAINNTSKHFGGQEIFKLSDKPSSISLVKSIETMNRYFQLKALGLEFVSGAVNWFGTNVQLAAQSGTYFTKGEVLKKQYELLGNKLDKEQGELFTALVNKFMPLREDPNHEAFKDAGMSVLTRGNLGDFLMMFMKYPEQLTEKAVFMTLLDNVMVQDGKMVNIRDAVKRKYAEERRTASALRLREIDKIIESEIEQLKKDKSIGSTMKMENGELVIPGLDLNNLDEIQKLTRLTRRISTSATGGINSENINRSQMNIWFKSAMIFKNWIPGLAFTRFDHLRKVSDDFSITVNPDGTTEGERYDIGRLRLFMYVLGTSIVQKSMNITNILSLNEEGLAELDRMFDKFSEEYYQREGEPLKMTREEFIDLIRTNLRNQVNELALTLALASTAMGMGMMAPDDDDSKADKNLFRYGQRVIDKFVSELTFFINPFEFQNILEGNLLPAIGVTTDITRFMTHFVMETTGLDISDPTKTAEEVRKDAQPIKNLAKMFPVTKSLINYWAMFDEEFAKEFDITIQKDTSR